MFLVKKGIISHYKKEECSSHEEKNIDVSFYGLWILYCCFLLEYVEIGGVCLK